MNDLAQVSLVEAQFSGHVALTDPSLEDFQLQIWIQVRPPKTNCKEPAGRVLHRITSMRLEEKAEPVAQSAFRKQLSANRQAHRIGLFLPFVTGEVRSVMAFVFNVGRVEDGP